MFSKYRKSNDDTKVLLIYLILAGFEMSKVIRLEESEEKRGLGVTVKKVFGITKDYVDVRKIESDLEGIIDPTICSNETFEYYAKADVIYTFNPQMSDRPLLINDLDVISEKMIISEKEVVSSNPAKSLMDTENLGFMFFYEYVMKSEVRINNWRISYHNDIFNIYYCSVDGGKIVREELLFSGIEMDKASTYKMVIYIIKKVAPDIEEWQSDNFIQTTYELIKEDEEV